MPDSYAKQQYAQKIAALNNVDHYVKKNSNIGTHWLLSDNDLASGGDS